MGRGVCDPSRRDARPHPTAARADTGTPAGQFKIVNVENNEELASVGS
jgi:hypothetical protein